MNQQIIVVDENDIEIGTADRESIVPGDSRIYRVSALWITNSKGEILLAQRAFTKKNDPGKWAFPVNGTNDVGETYESNILKESEEELGLKNIQIQAGEKVRVNEIYNFFLQCFSLSLDKPVKEFNIQKEEIAQLKWFSKDELRRLLKDSYGNFTAELRTYVESSGMLTPGFFRTIFNFFIELLY